MACGVALAAQARESGRVAIVSFGDGAMSQGSLHEAMVFAAARQLPVIFMCENNGWSELTPTGKIARIDRLARRSLGYGIVGVTVDGCDPVSVREAVAQAAGRARNGEGPSLIECKTVRLWGHYNRDIEHYRPASDKKDAAERDLIARLRARLVASDAGAGRKLDAIDASVASEIAAVVTRSLALPKPDPATARDHVYAPQIAVADPGAGVHEEEMTVAQALNRALRDELASNPATLVYGEDVGHAGGIFGVTRDLQKTFGEMRVFDTPIAESAILGSAVGAAMEGMHPIVEIMWSDFLLVALDPLINQAANVRYLTRGQFGAPMVVRTQQGATPGSCAQHSQCLEALFAHIPGLKVGLPSTPQDAYAMLRAAAGDPDPCILFEARGLYQVSGKVTLGGAVEPARGAKLRRPGKDLAIISWGTAVHDALSAAHTLADRGYDVGVLDLRWLTPLDEDAIAAAVVSCGRVLVVHEANQTMGFGAEVTARIAERLSSHLKSPVRRLGTPDMRMPASPVLKAALLPRANAIVTEALSILEPAISNQPNPGKGKND